MSYSSFFFFKQKTSYELRISDWSSDVCSSDLSSYEFFCAAGKQFDEKLAELGAQRVLDRLDCDLDYEAPSRQWIATVTSTFASLGDVEDPIETAAMDIVTSDATETRWTRQDPFIATISADRKSTRLNSSH